MMRTICVVITARPSYSRIKTVMDAIIKHKKLKLQLIVMGSALLDKYGSVVDFIEKDEDYEDFDNNQLEEFQLPSSKAIAGCQIHGNLIMDWHYVNIVHRNK